MSTIQQLHEIPDLAVEAWLTIDHPHRDAHNTGTKPTKAAAQPAPTNLHALTALQVPAGLDPEPPPPLVHRRGATEDEVLAVIGDQDNTGPLLADLLMAVRVIVEEFADTPRAGQLPDWPDHTWSPVCAWLRLCAPLWSSDAFTEEWVGDAVRKAHTGLRQLTRAPREVRLRCSVPGCIDRAHMQPGDQWLLCEAGHQIDIEAERWSFLENQDWTLAETRDACRTWLGVSVSMHTLNSWVRRGKLRPVDDSSPRRYRFREVRALIERRAA